MENLPDWTWQLDNPNASEYDCTADAESDIEQDNGFDDAECPEQRDVSAA